MWIGVLGPLEVRDDQGVPIEVAGQRLRSLLVRLAVDAGRLITFEALVDAVWSEEPPVGAANALQSLVSRLRRVLADDARIDALPMGYRLSGVTVDCGQFEILVGGEGDRGTALSGALDLVRGAPFADVPVAPGFGPAGRSGCSPRPSSWPTYGCGRPRTSRPCRAWRRFCERAGSANGPVCCTCAPWPHWDVRPRRSARSSSTGWPRRGAWGDPSAELRAAHTAVLRGEVRTNVRAPLTSFVGRTDELARVRAALGQARLVTLVGPGGAGKTRLATELARTAGGGFPDGAWLVELAGVGDGSEVPAAVLAALGPAAGLRESNVLSGPGPLERVTTALQGRRALLILDNCEHLLDACAQLAAVVLGECPAVRVLITTREPLNMTGEVLCPLGRCRCHRPQWTLPGR